MKKILDQIQRREFIVMPVLALIAVYMLFSALGIIMDNYRLEQELQEKLSNNKLLELQNDNLRFDIKYYETDEYLELAAREKLNLRHPDETVLVLPDYVDEIGAQEEAEEVEKSRFRENFEDWMLFLFNKEPQS